MVENLGTAARSALAALSPMPRPMPGAPPGGGLRLEAVMETLQRQQAARLAQGGVPPPSPHPIPPSLPPQRSHPVLSRAQQSPEEGVLGGTEEGENEEEEEEEEEDEEETRPQGQPPQPSPGPGLPVSTPNQPSGPQHHEWTYEEQFKQLYELDADPKRKEFLDDLFSFMQKRGTPVNRIPIMAKQVLDLYVLYRLVTEKGGLVEVINRKVWREVTRGLSLPTSITSAAFTLRTQYMKYLYPYECETRALSSPGELQAAIDSNRREGRRQTYGTAPLFSFPAAGAPPPPRGPSATSSATPGLPALACAQLGHSQGHGHAPIKKEEGSGPAPTVATPRISLPMALGPMREKIGPEEPPEKKAVLMGPLDSPRPALPPNLLPRSKTSIREEPLEVPLNMAGNGISSINMALEINGIVYTGVLFARRPPTVASATNNSRNSQGPRSPGLHTPPGPLSSTSP
ncbi:AT-rich interactive domain-containing protein 3C [Monodelphis domestica]|uniref:AT-rich interactive domain-containing protein 3C n=1 Tax=Monodelphis domestica TaxID=13616 RepID=UPI0024E1A200|nr:AT-rich interactive domain-containing protein 3C [Monodelphis domestica]